MKKFYAIVLAVLLIMSMAIPAYAVTPSFRIPNLPKVPEIQVDIDIPDSVFDDWFEEHPITLPTATEPEETEPIITELHTPEITSVNYMQEDELLQIEWPEVDHAEHYVVLIVRADADVETHTTTDNTLSIHTEACYADAVVRVMAMTTDVIGAWSDEKVAECTMIHN